MIECLGIVIIGLADDSSSGFLFAQFLWIAGNEHHFVGRDQPKKVPESAASKASRGREDAELVCHR